MTDNEFARLILGLSEEFSFSVTSWGRTEYHNKLVGGKVRSEHTKWMAVDCVFDPGTDNQTKAQFKEAVNEAGLGWMDEGDHIHVQRHLKDIKD